jgi:hypothetical protein
VKQSYIAAEKLNKVPAEPNNPQQEIKPLNNTRPTKEMMPLNFKDAPKHR